MLRDCLNPGGQILIGDVVFETRSQLEQCRKDVGAEWDEEEIYFVVDELKKDFPSLAFEQVSYCAGILSLVFETNMKQNLGFGTEAVIAFTEYVMNQLGLQRVFLRTNPNNRRAIHVYEKSGFREFDRTDDHVYMEKYR